MKQNIIIKKINEKIKPKRIYEELAEEGILDDFLNIYLNEAYNNDEVFRDEMLEIQLNYSTKPVKDLEIFYLMQLNKHLNYFLDSTNSIFNNGRNHYNREQQSTKP
jgi:hypothetical protein